MTLLAISNLSEGRRTVIMRAGVTSAAFLLLCLFAECVAAQQPPKRDDLDVTMQIIVDPDAKLPDEVVRRIPLPTRKPAETPPAATRDKPDTTATSSERSNPASNEPSNQASEHGLETSQAAQERAREAAEQREAARRAAAEERRREREPREPREPPDPPGRPPRP